MNLDDVPHEQIQVGDKVVSYRGRPGVITFAGQQRYFAVDIQWSTESPWENETSDVSSIYLYSYRRTPNPIEYLGQ